MSNPFADLKKLEMEILSKRRITEAKLERLRTISENLESEA